MTDANKKTCMKFDHSEALASLFRVRHNAAILESCDVVFPPDCKRQEFLLGAFGEFLASDKGFRQAYERFLNAGEGSHYSREAVEGFGRDVAGIVLRKVSEDMRAVYTRRLLTESQSLVSVACGESVLGMDLVVVRESHGQAPAAQEVDFGVDSTLQVSTGGVRPDLGPSCGHCAKGE